MSNKSVQFEKESKNAILPTMKIVASNKEGFQKQMLSRAMRIGLAFV